jgi:hypothetical protein
MQEYDTWVLIAIAVQSVHEEVQLRIAAAIRAVAVELQCLDPLLCESELVAKPRPTWVGITVDSELLKGCKSCEGYGEQLHRHR